MNNKTRNIITIVLCVLIVLCVGVTVWALFFRDQGHKTPDPITPDYPPQGTEENQTPIEGDDNSKIDTPEGGGGIRLEYNVAASANLSTKKVTFHYANSGASNQNVALIIMVGETVVAKSDLILPGYEVNELTLEDYAAELLQEGGYNATLLIRAYDPESGEKAMVDTEGELTLTVTK